MATPQHASFLEHLLRNVSFELGELGQAWALVGGLAVSARSEPRFTRDVDVAIAVSGDREAEALVRHFQARGYRVLDVIEQEVTERLATVRLEPPSDASQAAVLDLLFASSGIEPEIVERSSTLEVFPDLPVPVAGIAELLAAKVLSREDRQRPQDAVDIRNLLGEATPEDVMAARAALVLIAERGYDRGRDLLADLDREL